MIAGQLRQRVQIEGRAAGVDERGQASGAWEAVATVWARVQSLSGNELERARKIVADASHRVTIRYRADLTPKQRLIWRGRTLQIGAVLDDDDNRRRQLVLICQEAVT